tara:strand:- start:114 stop:1487 length:1374 start_codon:yes stop_codon:yes gene_type:complete
MATTYLRRNPSGSGNQRKFTFSFWVKKNSVNPASTYSLFDCGTSSNYFHIYFPDTHTLTVKSRISNSTAMELVTTRVFTDSSAWYNIIVAVDSEQNTAADRCKIYVNGVQETAFNTANYGSQNLDHEIQDAGTYHVIGTNYAVSADEFFDGSMSYVAFVDGTQEAPTIFGETDSTTGQWKIKTTITPSVGWGTNGFLILVNGNSVTDQSGQSNDFTVAAGTLTKTQDCPSNNFATMNPLDNYYAGSTFTNGNLSVSTLTSSDTFNNSTLGYATGKYYWETKNIRVSTNNYNLIGITSKGSTASNNYMMSSLYSVVLKQDGVLWQNAGSGSGAVSGWSGSSYTTGDIIGIAHDATNNKIYIHKNGVYMNSGNPSTGANGITTTASSLTDTGFWLAAVGDEISSGTSSQYTLNFGNGYFGTTAVTTNSGNGYAGAEGSSIFNYQPPTGYSALSTKGLNV